MSCEIHMFFNVANKKKLNYEKDPYWIRRF